MSTAATPLHVLMAIYRMVVALCNACIVFLQVMRSAMQEAKQEAAEVMALLDDDMMVSPPLDSFLGITRASLADRPVLPHRTRSRPRRCYATSLDPRTRGQCWSSRGRRRSCSSSGYLSVACCTWKWTRCVHQMGCFVG